MTTKEIKNAMNVAFVHGDSSDLIRCLFGHTKEALNVIQSELPEIILDPEYEDIYGDLNQTRCYIEHNGRNFFFRVMDATIVDGMWVWHDDRTHAFNEETINQAIEWAWSQVCVYA